MSKLKNPMRFSIRNRTVDIGDYLHNSNSSERRVTKIEIEDGQMYVYWEEV